MQNPQEHSVLARRIFEALLGVDENKPLVFIWTVTIGLIVTGVITSLFYDILTKPNDVTSQIVLRVLFFVAIGIFLTIGPIISYYQLFKEPQLRIKLDESDADPSQWVISSLSPYASFGTGGDNLGTIRKLIQFHAPQLAKLYLIHTPYDPNEPQDRIKQSFDILRQELPSLGINIPFDDLIERIEIDTPNEVEPVVKVIDRIAREARQSQKTYMVDITAGTKVMSVGLVLAALVNKFDATYLVTKGAQGDEKSKEQSAVVKLNFEGIPLNQDAS